MNYIFILIIIFLIFMAINFLINKQYIEKLNNHDFNNLSIDDRVKYYMKDTYNTKIYISNKLYSDKNYIINVDKTDTISIKNDYKIYKTNIHSLDTINTKSYKNYINDMKYILSLNNEQKTNNLQLALGDINTKCNFKGTLAKSRNVDDNNIILLKLNYPRHWKKFSKVRAHDIPFHEKNNKIIWRGVTTGYHDKYRNRRYILVSNYYNHKNKNIDIGFNSIVQNRNDFKKYLKKPMTIQQQLKSKYIISVEGNDVPSGLKWQLYSNSVVFMAKPKVSSWLMEDRLIPGVHYILLKDDYSDLEEKYNWALNNEKECLKISKNSKEYMEQFLDKEKEDKITNLIMEKYYQNVVFTN